MLAGAANAAPTPAPARHHGLSKVPLGVPFATSRANSRPATLECRHCNPRGHDVQRFQCAMSAEKQIRRCAARVELVCEIAPRLTGRKFKPRFSRYSFRVSGQVSLAATRRRETVRTHFADELCLTLCPQTPRRTACAPVHPRAAVLALRSAVKESDQWLRADATRPTN